ncbi:glycosyltransferase family 4 protein [Massilia sp. SR12]
MARAEAATALPVYLFVLPWGLKHRGGVTQVVLSLARELQAGGQYEPVVLVSDWNAAEPVWDALDGIRIVYWRLQGWVPGMGWRARLGAARWAWRNGAVFRRLCREQRVAAINVHYPGLNAFAVAPLARRCGGLPLILSFHGSDVVQVAQAAAPERRAWRGLLRHASATTTCSGDLAGQLRQVLGDDTAVTAIHNGVDAPDFRATALAPPALGGRVLLSVGRFDDIKGQDVLLTAFAELAAQDPQLQLVLVGASGPLLPALRTQAAALGLAPRVHFLADLTHREVAGWMRQAELFILPSRREAFGMVLLEAGAFGVPVVASAVGGVPEVIRDGATGRLVPPGDAAALAQAMRAMLDAPQAARAMGQSLQRDVDQHFSWRAACGRYLDLLA